MQPLFDHHQIIEDNGEYAYNWGYDPENYNVPDASFTSNPHEPATRILELKEVIQAYHDAGINVIMDVVYNHTFSSRDSAFQLAVPDYYYRMNPNGTFQNGSGCGNEMASEKEMYRKYMLDSILYWTKEFNIDGFRFDLMGLHDIETMNLIRRELDKIDPRILVFGEGWDMGVGLALNKKLKKIMLIRCQELVSLMMISVTQLKAQKSMGPLRKVLPLVQPPKIVLPSLFWEVMNWSII